MSVASPTTTRHYHKTTRSLTMIVCRLWHELLATLAASNAAAVRSRTFWNLAPEIHVPQQIP